MTTDEVLLELRSRISPESFKAYFSQVEFRLEGSEAACVLSPTRYVKDNLEKFYKRDILAAIRKFEPAVLELEFCLARRPVTANVGAQPTLGSVLRGVDFKSAQHGDGTQSGTQTVTRNGARLTQNSSVDYTAQLAAPLSAYNTLETFENGVCNKTACSAALTVAESPGSIFNPLCVHGPHGVGKTHLLQGIALGILARAPEKRVLYTTSESFANSYIAALQVRKLDEFRACFKVCVLLMEDLHFLIGKTKTQEELLHIIQRLRGAGKQVVFSSNLAPLYMNKLNPGLLEIVRSGLVLSLDTPEFELRVKLLHALAKRRNWVLEPDAARIIATHVDQSVGALDGALCKTLALARACGAPANGELALSALSKLGHVRNGPLSHQDILSATAKFYKVSEDDVRSDKRAASLVHARHMAMHLARHLTGHTSVEIGRFFGNRDHTSVLHAVRKINGLLKREEVLREEQRLIKQALGR